MSKIKITKPFDYPHAPGPHSYSLRPEMGEVDHFPERVCKAAVDAGCAEYVDKKPAKNSRKRDTANPAK